MRLLLSSVIIVIFLGLQCTQPPRLPMPDEDNGGLIMPEGFGALVVAEAVGLARHLAVNTNGDIYVKLRYASGDKGSIALRDNNQDGRADVFERFGGYPNDGSFATEMRIHKGYLYFSSEKVVYRQKLINGQLLPEGQPEALVTDPHPLQWHNAKTLAFDGQGGMYVTFSSPTNNCEDWNTVPEKSTAQVKGMQPCPELTDHAGVWRFDEARPGQSLKDGQRFATGLRSIVGMTWNKQDNSLYAVIHGRDYLHNHAPQYYSEWLGAMLPAEELVKIKPGDDFGWPYSYYDHLQQKRMVAPEYGGDGKTPAQGFTDPLLGLPAHWAPNDLLFYQGSQFPPRYKEGAFIAFHGSTNRTPYPQGGYIIAFVPFAQGVPTGSWEVFADGFAGVDTIKVMEDARFRPVGLAEGPDGSLYVTDSKRGKIWRILYYGEAKAFGPAQLAAMEARKSRSYLKNLEEEKDRLK